MTIFNNSNKSLLNNINEIMLHGTLLPESIFNVALASLMPSCPQISPNLTKSSAHFLRRLHVFVHVTRGEKGRLKGRKRTPVYCDVSSRE